MKYNFEYRDGVIRGTVEADSEEEAINKIKSGKVEYNVIEWWRLHKSFIEIY